ncbi:hypothetical protein [Flavobacterium silvaticum]|uniref:DUF4595 domain-containing protein n=1 Tax=Flavobacterium silvaticum TaxID=1852020 RepID=A0A972JHW2_9FLAO|nr:hypothetical protein [Flavobacterium silvaticum]NMH26667.1 hypothetical protein [Flavobacterium silvaticum]
MKKIAFLLGFVAISLTSCSSDDSGSSTDDGSDDVLIKKIVYTDDTDDFTQVIQYTYSGNKIVQATYDDGSVDTYTYSGDLITQIDQTMGSQLLYRDSFTYDGNGRLTLYVSQDIEDEWEETESFVYNSDGTVTSNYDGLISTLHFENDEVTQMVQTGFDTYTYTYDGKNSPFKNVTGYSKIAFANHGDHEFFGAKQNIISIHDDTNDIDYMTNTLTYNANNYPTSSTSVAIFDSEGTYTANVQYTYY